jgi:hypothetical protein
MSDTVKVITNNVPRDTIDAWELNADERAHFDYLDWSAIDAGNDSATFFRYKGELYDMSEFSASWGLTHNGGLPHWLNAWDGYMSDSFWSGMVVRYVKDDINDRIVVGRYYS